MRRKVSLKHDKLTAHEIDYLRLTDYKNLVIGDVLFSALGTTKHEAGSKKNQYFVDYDYQLEFTKMESDNRVDAYSLVSSFGANENSIFFYPKIKGALELAIKKLPFKKIQIFQPPLLLRQTHLIRASEKVVLKCLKLLNNIGVLRSLSPLLVSDLAVKMVTELKLNNSERITIYKPKDLITT